MCRQLSQAEQGDEERYCQRHLCQTHKNHLGLAPPAQAEHPQGKACKTQKKLP